MNSFDNSTFMIYVQAGQLVRRSTARCVGIPAYRHTDMNDDVRVQDAFGGTWIKISAGLPPGESFRGGRRGCCPCWNLAQYPRGGTGTPIR